MSDKQIHTQPDDHSNPIGIERSQWRVLIVDPQPAVRQVVGDFLKEFYRLSLSQSGDRTITFLAKQDVDVMLVNDQLPGEIGARALIRHAQANYPDLPIIVLSGEKATKAGVVEVGTCSFVPKKILRTEVGRAQLLLLIDRRIHAHQHDRRTVFQRQQQQRAGMTAGHFLIGRSPTIEALRETAVQAGRSRLNVLITGETGVGKTLLAQAVHLAGEQASSRPYVTLDPSTLVPSLFEAELFGHARGAFTGATHAQVGAFEAANGGTLLLDEIGDLPLDLQRKLLQAVEERVIRRVGDVREIHLNVRLIAATNRNLERDVENGRFRADLYQRLNELRVHIPPLRERKEDVAPLLAYFIEQYHHGGSVRTNDDAERIVRGYDWPGNVREVRTLARRLCAEGIGDTIHEEELIKMLPTRVDRTDSSDLPPEERIRVYSRRAYLQVLKEHAYNIRGTARTLDVPYHTLRSRLKSLDLLHALRKKPDVI